MESGKQHSNGNPVFDFFMNMTICNTVVVSRNRRESRLKDSTDSISTISIDEQQPFFEAESPDELALVEAAHSYEFELIERVPGFVTVSLPGMHIAIAYYIKAKPKRYNFVI